MGITPDLDGTSGTYEANCHCGNVKFQVNISPALENYPVSICSICTHNGYALIYPYKKDIKFIQGKEALKDYRFGDKNLTHKFCPNCGTPVLFEFQTFYTELIGINVRTFKDIDMTTLKYKNVDGKSLSPKYEV
ncbi:hypothetical protein L228DRAFT_269977 [Xylona heveae TC161]|uniref:CENP-V/GFA domain-containing protein n=1 Tax=Xylona heveae (strain CBS 132557 / TC161) TaxID=1328760 RepID=A0A165F821_XYLHT|nr:hypothetical protein L228DRAFT_269977 [Xylona heveae TC161]KZF20683.1 hypothetical protein L228DRAFT_269977 [Xylona heveae TC161]